MTAVAVPVPLSVEQVTARWLESALGHAGHDVQVSSVEHERIIGGNATKVLLRADYANPTDLPTRLCVKVGMELQDPTQNLTGSTYDIEGRFYLDIAPQLDGLIAPRCLSVIIDPQSHRCCLVMEDLTATGGRFCSASEGSLAIVQVDDVVQQLAQLHGRWPGGTTDVPGSEFPIGIDQGNRLGRYYGRFDRSYLTGQFERPRGAQLPEALRDADILHNAFWTMAHQSIQAPHSLIHADPHLSNIFLRGDGRPGIADWQTMRWGRWSHDIAYHVTSSLTIDDRRAAERDLLAHYVDALAEAGGPRLTRDEVQLDYRRSMFYGLYGWLTNPDYFGYPEEVSVDYVAKFAAATVDLETIDALTRGT